MYFSSDSWGKLGKIMDVYSDKLGIASYDKEIEHIAKETELLDKLVEKIFNSSGFENLTRLEIMKKILEGLRMPVKNPKTGEEDYVDVSLVDKIVIDSEYIESTISNAKVKVDITLNGDKATNEVIVTASNSSVSMKEMQRIPLHSFEEMLFKAINEIKSQRLEEVPEFHEITNGLIDHFIDQARSKNEHFAAVGKTYTLIKGVGIIRDIKTDQDVGTFETFEYVYDKNQRTTSIEHILLSGRTFEDLKEKDRFDFTFYSLEQKVLHSVIAGEKAKIKVDEQKSSVNIETFNLLVGLFDETHKYYQTAMVAQEKKAFIVDIDESHPLYVSRLEEFRQSRLDILEESKSKQKQEKLVGQFADIDLGLDF